MFRTQSSEAGIDNHSYSLQLQASGTFILFSRALPQLPDDVIDLFLAFAMPHSETAFESVRACLVPLPDKPPCLVPSIGAGWFFDTVRYCSFCFRLVDDDVASGLDQAQIEAATLPQDPESRNVIIRSGRYPTWCEFENMLAYLGYTKESPW